MIFYGKILFVLILCIGLAILFKLVKRIIPLLLWLGIPTFIILSLLFGIKESIDTTLRIVMIAFSAIIAFTSPKPYHVAYVANKLGIPPIIGFSQLYVLRLLQILNDALREAIYAAIGRGIRSRLKIITLLPIPLLVHTIDISVYLAEALYIKYPSKTRSWIEKAYIGKLDIVVFLYITISTLAYNILLLPF